jgi:hypothetical protein
LEGIENCRLLKCTLHYKPIRRRSMERFGRDGKTGEPEQTLKACILKLLLLLMMIMAELLIS